MGDEIVVNGDRFELFIPEGKILARTKELAGQINTDFRGKVPILIGVLNGAFVFFSDLLRDITIDCEVDFLKLSSYGDAKISSGDVRMLKELNCQVTDRHIVIVEDIVDSGLSIDYIRKLVLHQKPKSFTVVTLLFKKEAAKIKVPLEYVGFEIPNRFVIGYGLDYAQKMRNLRSIYAMVEDRNMAAA
jgi:hypoxanthine phosphoribosyltransferase